MREGGRRARGLCVNSGVLSLMLSSSESETNWLSGRVMGLGGRTFKVVICTE